MKSLLALTTNQLVVVLPGINLGSPILVLSLSLLSEMVEILTPAGRVAGFPLVIVP
jgi:hypothetical protein